ncbi:iron chelate uptake ABC transporter family permease subunit [Clostridium sp. D53t1_180928_C8]|uniref:iron chelate uptake ABC transporter family permease subunit n=1 Tax=Clostridium sp. D53t1_180928_C8 TaxID=2787101 RepID=UPI0018AC72FA
MTKYSSRNLILRGVAVGYLFSVLVSLLKYMSNIKDLPKIVFGIMVSLSNIKIQGIILITISSIIYLILIICNGWKFNVISYGRVITSIVGVQLFIYLIIKKK